MVVTKWMAGERCENGDGVPMQDSVECVCVHIPPQSRHGPHYRHAVLTQQVFRRLFHVPVFQRQRRPRLMLKTNKVYGYSSSQDTCLTATGTHMPYGITQCYLPPGRGDIPAFTPAEAGTRLSDPRGMQG